MGEGREEPTDAELIGRSLGGEGNAFVEVVRRHARPVSAYLVRRVGRELAEDLLAETWVSAFASRSSYDRAYADARAWLIGIAHNVLRAHWRRASHEDVLSEVQELANPWPEVDERLDAEAATGLRQALSDLPADEREVLLLVAWEQLSVADAARSLGIPAGTARYRLHRARRLLRQAILADLNRHHNIESVQEAQ
ncbi:MAG: RNA polymerase sigma factor [Acidimicrobiales bacterium]